MANANPDHPKLNEWIEHLKKAIGKADNNTVLVGHALGCMAILRYLEQMSEDEKVQGILLVAGFADSIGIKEIESFFEKPLEYGKVKAHANSITVIASDNDYYVPIKHGNNLKEKLGAKLIIAKGFKHFSASDGILELPIALESVVKIFSS